MKGLRIFGGVLAAFLFYVSLQSPDYVISREISISAPAEKIFPYLNNSKLAEQWGPWLETDTGVRMVYTGPDEGVGSKASWDSTGQLGTGSATIVASVPNQQVDIRLDYTKPMPMVQQSTYLIRTDAGKSVVSWRVRGTNNFIGRVACVFMDMDKMVGGMFEKGLAKLKTVVESQKP